MKLLGGTRLKDERMFELENPIISVITVVYNGARHLEQTINSVLSQNYFNIEYLIVDGGSTDGTLDIIRKYEDKIDYWISEPDKGIYDAMNKGISLAKGEYIGIINSDDYFEKGIFTELIPLFKKGIDIIHGDVIYMEMEKFKFVLKPQEKLNLKSFKEMPINHPTAFIHTNVYSSIGVYDTTYKIAADWEFILRCFLKNRNFYYFPKPISIYRLGGISSTKALAAYKEIFKTISKRKLLPKSLILLYWGEAIIKFYIKQLEGVPVITTLIGFYRNNKSRTSVSR